MRHSLLTTIGLLLFGAGQALAANSLSATWQKESSRIREALENREWEEVEHVAAALGDRLIAGRLDDSAGPRPFAQVAAWRAAALAELGRREEAEWFWLTALALSPDVVQLDLSQYSGKWDSLKSLRPSVEGRDQALDDPRVVTARAVRHRAPVVPNRGYGGGAVIVSCFVTRAGAPRDPVVLDGSAQSPALRYTVLAAISTWRFEPASLNGTPVETPFRSETRFQWP